MSFFKRLGVPGPEPNIIFGNLLEYRTKTPIECHRQWIEDYGKVLGYYFGNRPVLLVADLQILKQIQVKEAHNFINRPDVFDVGITNRKHRLSQHLATLRGKRWKEVRSTLTPAFTGLKLKQMYPVVSDCVSSLVERLESRRLEGKPVDLFPLFQELTLDVIGQSALGVRDEKSKRTMLDAVRTIFALEMDSFVYALGYAFREFHCVLGYVMHLAVRLVCKGRIPYLDLGDACFRVVSGRRKDAKERRRDLLQNMIDAERVEGSDITDQQLTQDDTAEANGETEHRPLSSQAGRLTTLKKSVGLTDEEVVSNAILVFFLFLVTTRSTLAFCIQQLILHPEIQEKVHEELDAVLGGHQNDAIEYSMLQKLTYLDQVFNETLRICPPIYQFVFRESVEECRLDRWTIPPETAIFVPVYYLHHDPEVWPDPEIFDPERFGPDRKSSVLPGSFQAFGTGPRNCIGMRFAQMEGKLALASLLRKYRFLPTGEPRPRTKKVEETFSYSLVSIAPKAGVLAAVQLRSKSH